ncbi:hypothetical protein JZ751_005748 [Albula glossodonta]|uniref:Uncharacterized protein n=1 Tax=Albula glossodonta TaxID=121402 RepID=A0A8T2NBL6_9TELE|nr:hypothetical protein JZ751_005748 [Albula glossodonta]
MLFMYPTNIYPASVCCLRTLRTFLLWHSCAPCRRRMITYQWTWSCRDGKGGCSGPSWCAARTCTRRGAVPQRSATRTRSTPTTRQPTACTTSVWTTCWRRSDTTGRLTSWWRHTTRTQ